MPDLCYGRIPASTKEEMKNVADKIWKYENSNNAIEPTTRFLGAAFFQDNLTPYGQEDREYVKTVESICSTLESKFDYIDRVYCTSGNVVPNAWHEGIIGFPFPNYLKNESAWQGKTQDIINSINANCNIVLHRDHGADDGWDKPSFLRSHLSQLTNTTYPIVFSINCNTGNFAVPNSFSKALLCQKQGGAAGIIGATAPSYTYRNDVIALAIMKSIWPSLDFKTYRSDYELNAEFDQPVATLGEALAVGLIKMEETFPEKTIILHNVVNSIASETRQCIYIGTRPAI